MYDRFGYVFFFFNDTATTEIYTLSLHDALPIWTFRRAPKPKRVESTKLNAPALSRSFRSLTLSELWRGMRSDRKSTRLNSSHANISYAVFCLKKKKKTQTT